VSCQYICTAFLVTVVPNFGQSAQIFISRWWPREREGGLAGRSHGIEQHAAWSVHVAATDKLAVMNHRFSESRICPKISAGGANAPDIIGMRCGSIRREGMYR